MKPKSETNEISKTDRMAYPIIDANCHLWQLDLGIYPWLQQEGNDFLGDIRAIRHDYMIDDYKQDAQAFQVDKIVVVEASGAAYAKDEVRWLNRLDDNGFLHAIIAGIDLSTKDVEKTLAFYQAANKVTGVRHILNWHHNPRYCCCDAPDYLQNTTWRKGFNLLAKYQLSFDMQVNPHQLDDVAALAKQYDDTLIVLEHTGLPITDEIIHWRQAMAKLADYPNVAIKISGFGMLGYHYDVASIRDCILSVIDQFGTARTMFASNFPVERLYSSYENIFRTYFSIVDTFSAAEKKQLFHDNALNYYNPSH